MKNKAFTLVELLGVIVLLGILGVVIIPKVGDSISNSREKAYETQLSSIKKGAIDFLADNTEVLESNNTITIKLGTLKQGGYLPINIKNPKTRKNFSNESLITITKSGENYNISLSMQDLQNVTENIDENSPILVLNGSYVEYVEVNSEYTDLGAKAYSNDGIELSVSTPTIKLNDEVKSQVDTSNLNTYSIIYEVTDANNKTTSATRTVIVRDSTSPIITVPKETNLHVSEVATFNRTNGVSVTDNYDNNVILTVDSTLANLPGNYIITYTATDHSGNKTTERRVINVNDNIYESHEITYQIPGKTTASTTSAPTMESPVTYYGLGQNGIINVTTIGKNMFDEESILMAIKGATYENGHYVFEVGQAYQKYKKIIPGLKFKENTQYTISINGYTTANNANNWNPNFRFRFKYTDETEEECWVPYNTENTRHCTSTSGKTIEKMYMYYGYGGTVYISHIQLEEGTTATEFEPYKGRTTTIDMTGHDPLMCSNGICDYIDYENKRIVRYIKKYTFRGNEPFNTTTWASQNTETTKGVYWSNSSVLGSYPNNLIFRDIKGFCSHFPLGSTAHNIDDTLRYGPRGISSPPYLSFRIPIDTDMNTWTTAQYNAGTPLIAYYVLENPEYEPINLPSISKYYDDKHIIAYDENGAVEVTY